MIFFRIYWLNLLAVQGTLKSLQHHSSKASILWCSAFFIVQFSHPHMTTAPILSTRRETHIPPTSPESQLLALYCMASYHFHPLVLSEPVLKQENRASPYMTSAGNVHVGRLSYFSKTVKNHKYWFGGYKQTVAHRQINKNRIHKMRINCNQRLQCPTFNNRLEQVDKKSTRILKTNITNSPDLRDTYRTLHTTAE